MFFEAMSKFLHFFFFLFFFFCCSLCHALPPYKRKPSRVLFMLFSLSSFFSFPHLILNNMNTGGNQRAFIYKNCAYMCECVYMSQHSASSFFCALAFIICCFHFHHVDLHSTASQIRMYTSQGMNVSNM